MRRIFSDALKKIFNDNITKKQEKIIQPKIDNIKYKINYVKLSKKNKRK